jgi:hypothetical protein
MVLPASNGGDDAASRGPRERPAGGGDATDFAQEHVVDPEDSLRIRVHHVELHPEDVTVLDGIPITAPARTLLDLAEVVDERKLRYALSEALRRELTDRSEILAVIDRYPGHRGGPRLRALIEAWPDRR